VAASWFLVLSVLPSGTHNVSSGSPEFLGTVASDWVILLVSRVNGYRPVVEYNRSVEIQPQCQLNHHNFRVGLNSAFRGEKLAGLPFDLS
jgi:hypothetical protein